MLKFKIMIYHYSVVPGLILMGIGVQLLILIVVVGFQPLVPGALRGISVAAFRIE